MLSWPGLVDTYLNYMHKEVTQHKKQLDAAAIKVFRTIFTAADNAERCGERLQLLGSSRAGRHTHLLTRECSRHMGEAAVWVPSNRAASSPYDPQQLMPSCQPIAPVPILPLPPALPPHPPAHLLTHSPC